MKLKARVLAIVVLGLVAGAANAVVTFVNLGIVAPPATLGPYSVPAFSQVPQAAISNGTSVTQVPGGPNGAVLTLSQLTQKATVPLGGWNNWSNGYTGAVYFTTTNATPLTRLITLPAGTKAFYFYTEGDNFATVNVTVTPSPGAPVTQSVTTPNGANGFGFFTSGEDLVSVQVDIDPAASGFAVGEFGLNSARAQAIPTLQPEMLAATLLLLLGAGIWARRRRRA